LILSLESIDWLATAISDPYYRAVCLFPTVRVTVSVCPQIGYYIHLCLSKR